MQHIKPITSSLSISLLLLISSFTAAKHSAIAQPKFSLQPLTPVTAQLSATDTATIQYLVSNNTTLTRTLTMVPIAGVTSDNCGNNFTLAQNQSCVLTLTIAGNQVSANGIHGGPVICTTQNYKNNPNPFLCSQPIRADLLNIDVVTRIAIAAGSYTDNNSIAYPLLAVSQDSGATWNFPASITQPSVSPAFADNGNFTGAHCSGKTCIAVGNYEDSNTFSHPLLAVSQDSGNTWSYPSSITELSNVVPAPSTANLFAGLAASTCNDKGQFCIAVGYYLGETEFLPLAAVSHDSGKTWHFPTSITTPNITPALDGFGVLNSISCSGNICIASGSYNDSNNITRFFLALSQDAGNSWSFPTAVTEPNLSPTFSINGGSLAAGSCSGKLCVATGSYNDINNNTRPVLAVTQDGGNTWNFPVAMTDIESSNITPAFASDGELAGVSCHGSICIAIGSYYDSNNVEHPLLAETQDGGSTWSYNTSVTVPNLLSAPAFASGQLSGGASCTALSCIAAGQYVDVNSVTRPLLAVSQDAGNTWTFPTSITMPDTTPDFASNGNFQNFSGASCSGVTCIVTGTYTDSNSINRPLVALSKDAGNTWSYPQTISMPNILSPNAFNQGALNSTSITINSG